MNAFRNKYNIFITYFITSIITNMMLSISFNDGINFDVKRFLGTPAITLILYPLAMRILNVGKSLILHNKK